MEHIKVGLEPPGVFKSGNLVEITEYLYDK